MLLGSILGGAIAQMMVLSCGEVVSRLDAKAAADSPSNADSSAGADGPTITASSHTGFSYHVNGATKPAGWNSIAIGTLDYNTFTPTSYDISTGTFTAPMAGYYRFSTYGFSPTATPGADSRVSLGLVLNGTTIDHIVAVAGGQLSQVDSPMPLLSHVLHLSAGDKISIMIFSTTSIRLGASNDGLNAYYFQGEYLGG